MNNEPAFPVTREEATPGYQTVTSPVTYSGLSKREWFAGMALQWLIQEGVSYEDTAEDAFKIADKMITESEKSKP